MLTKQRAMLGTDAGLLHGFSLAQTKLLTQTRLNSIEKCDCIWDIADSAMSQMQSDFLIEFDNQAN